MPQRDTSFVPLPDDPEVELAWPTPNRALARDPGSYFARTAANPDYGLPGWTRECGKRFHRGCDISPVNVTPTGRSTTVMFTDCESETEYESEQPTWTPHDPVFAVLDGVVHECVADPSASSYGCHVVLRHAWPGSGKTFYTLYAHLDSVEVQEGQQVSSGHPLGMMGVTSSSEDACNWMAIAPHLHLEFWNEEKRAYDPVVFLKRYLAP